MHVPNHWVAFYTNHSWSQRMHGVLLHLSNAGIAALLRDLFFSKVLHNCTKRSVISIDAPQLRPEMVEGSAQEDMSLDSRQVFSVLCYCMNHLLARRYHTQLEMYSEFTQSMSHDIHPIGHDSHKTTLQMDVATSGHDEAYACVEVQCRMLRENVTHPATRITGRRKNRATWVTRMEKSQWRHHPFSHASPSTDTQPLPLLLLNSTFVLGTIGIDAVIHLHAASAKK
ncbi:hypothetical protein VPH35_028563 [Triticum aestivum]